MSLRICLMKSVNASCFAAALKASNWSIFYSGLSIWENRMKIPHLTAAVIRLPSNVSFPDCQRSGDLLADKTNHSVITDVIVPRFQFRGAEDSFISEISPVELA
jgi:hypothetical protein